MNKYSNESAQTELLPGGRLKLPESPGEVGHAVQAWEEPVEMLSFLPDEPDPNPMFLEKRVYQGSSGEVYPLPFIDRISTQGALKSWRAIHLENRYLRLMVLPEIGGRIHIGFDKTSGYDFFYRQNVIKPALVGLAGPWVSGGVEFNWPQHHRPATFMPVDTEIERHDDGSVTVWCSDYDRASGMKGMHGICLHPDRAVVELKARLYNPTERVQTFLWWANVAAKVHEHYQSFFPPDVRYVADHAKRGVSSFPFADGKYYGVDYAQRAAEGVPADEEPADFKPQGYPANDLSRYANIPVPTSYMIVQTEGDFFGGYDHAAEAGFVHVANHHISPGKKQWTWGNHEFGYAWDRCLTEEDGPYVELMAGVYTDNQPDFSYIAPGETKTFSQFWYPLRKSGVPLAANLEAAVRLEVEGGVARILVSVPRDLLRATVLLKLEGTILSRVEQTIRVESGFSSETTLPVDCSESSLSVEILEGGRRVLELSLKPGSEKPIPALATEPLRPAEIDSVDLLYLTGLHLEQYRHATRAPEAYWREALGRDPGDSRCNHAMAKAYLRRGEYALAEAHVRKAIERSTQLNPNPYDSECFYTLGLVLRHLNRKEEAYAAFYKATWGAAWRSAGYYELAQIDSLQGDLDTALGHLRLSLSTNGENLNVRNLCVSVMRKLGLTEDAGAMLAQTRALDPLDLWSRYLDGKTLSASGYHLLPVALICERSGLPEDAIALLKSASGAALDGSQPLVHLALARCYEASGRAEWQAELQAAADASPRYCFPDGLEQLALLHFALDKRPDVGRFHYYLGNLLYHHRRHAEAITAWEQCTRLDANAQAWRNLGIAYYNTNHDSQGAKRAFDLAVEAAPEDGRILYERDQLYKCLGADAESRLRNLLGHPVAIGQRDDLGVEVATLWNELDKPAEALEVLLSRQFQPWEGGEGLVLTQFTAAHLKLGQAALLSGKPQSAVDHFMQILHPPQSLGEMKHLLANDSSVQFLLGEAFTALGAGEAAEKAYHRSAEQVGDFQAMAVQQFSEMTYWSGSALQRLGRKNEADELFQQMIAYAEELASQPATIDYFATSLPTLLLFEDDLEQRLKIRALLLRGAAMAGLGKQEAAEAIFAEVLKLDANCLFALDLLQQMQSTYRASSAGRS